MEDRRVPRIEDTRRMMVIHRPSTLRDGVIKLSTSFKIMLGQDMITHITTVFPLSR